MKKKISLAVLGLIAVAITAVVAWKPGVSVAEDFDVAWTKTLLEMPGNGYFTNNDVPLAGATWLDGGSFAVSSFCSGGDNSKGLWVFGENGNLAGRRDTCKDIGEGANGSAAHAWSVSANIQPVGSGGFVKEMSGNNNRPPAYYTISGGQLSYASQAFPLAASGNGSDTMDNVAAIPGYAVVLKNSGTIVLYSLPGWSVLQTMNASFVPITGVGNYIVGTPQPGSSGLVLYKVSNNALEFVGNVTTNMRPVAAAVDVSSQGSRVGFLFLNDGGAGRNHVAIYNVTSSGLTLARDVVLPNGATSASTGWKGNLAIAGDNVAFVDCGLPAVPAPANGSSDFASARTCGLAVMRGTASLKVQRLPNAFTVAPGSATPVETTPPAINGIAISPNGTILATSYYGAYLYKIGGTPGTSSGPPIVNPTPPNTSSTPPVLPVAGQTMSITLSVGSTTSSVLIRNANVLSIATSSLRIAIFGHTYTVDVSRSEIVNSAWIRTPLIEFALTHYANVWGALDPNDGTLIRSWRVRNPVVVPPGTKLTTKAAVGAGTGSGDNTANAGVGVGTDPAPTTAPSTATQNALNALQKALQDLRARVGQ